MTTSKIRTSEIVARDDEIHIAGQVFGTPIVTKGLTWLPLVELGGWLIMAWYAGQRRPERSWPTRLGVGALTMPVLLGSEWCHNLAHAAAAQAVGKPMDALRVTWGMPLVVYYDIEDRQVTPRQHILRALGGPLFNAGLLAFCLALQRASKPDGLAREVADVAVGMNAFLCSVSLLPIPGIDGGPILKWSLVEAGKTPAQADETLRKVNGPLGILLGILSGLFIKRRKHLLGGFLGLLAATSLSIAGGLLRESKESPWLRNKNQSKNS